MHAHAGDVIHIPTNGFTLFDWSTGGGKVQRYAAMAQAKAGKKEDCKLADMGVNNVRVKIPAHLGYTNV